MTYPTAPGVMPRYDQKTGYLTRTAYKVIWADGRAVQYFEKQEDADAFYRDYREWDSTPPVIDYVQKGARINKTYKGPHPSVKKAR